MLYQLSYVRVSPERYRTATRLAFTGRGGSVLRSLAEVDAEGQDPVVQGGLSVTDDGEVLEVGLGLVDEPLTLLAAHRWQGPSPHGSGAFSEPLHHGVQVEFRLGPGSAG